MSYRIVRPALLIAVALLAGCNTGSNMNQYTQAQLNALTTRTVEADLDETFKAASNALFDAGYTIAMSDRQGGLLTGEKAKDQSAKRFWVDPNARDTQFVMSIQMREQSSVQTDIRVQTSRNGTPYVDDVAIRHLWVLMQRQVLMKEPLAVPEGE